MAPARVKHPASYGNRGKQGFWINNNVFTYGGGLTSRSINEQLRILILRVGKLRRDWEIPIEIEPIGYVRTEVGNDEVRNAWISGGVEGTIEILPEYEPGLEGIDGFSHLIIIAWLHKAVPWHRKVLRVKPRLLARFGIPLKELPLVGVFATDSPDRPNPIAIDIVEFLGRKGRFLRVKGLDLFNGTPVLDLRPLDPDSIPDPSSVRVSAWASELKRKLSSILGKNIRI